MTRYFFALLLLIAPIALQATIYKWVDENGKTHYSQTRPPESPGKESTLIGQRTSLQHGAIDPEYCTAIQRFSTTIAENMRRGVSVQDMTAHLRGADDELKALLGTNEPVVRQVIYAVYGYRPSSMSPVRIGRLIQQNCMNGSFSVPHNRQASTTQSMGTGWPVTPGVIVTNYHVVENGKHYELILPSGTHLNAKLAAFDRASDIALLRIDPDKHRFDPISLDTSQQNIGTDVFTIGYPHPDVMGSEAKLTNGIINALSGYKDDPRTFQISVPLQSGNSGGPLLNLGGRAVGIVTSKLSAVTMFQATGDLPQNVNYAIKSSHIKQLLSQNSISDYADEKSAGTATLSAAADKIKSQVVLVIVK